MKQFILLILGLTVLSCSNPGTLEIKSNEKLIRQYFQYFNQHNWQKMSELYADPAVFKDPSLGTGKVKQQRAEIIRKYRELSQMFPDVKDKIVNLYHSGNDHIIVEFISTGTAPDRSEFKLPVCTIFKIESGLITEDFTYYDNFD
jgi:predicted SnoaL-like aldol condensation-catalyzing enzyme